MVYKDSIMDSGGQHIRADSGGLEWTVGVYKDSRMDGPVYTLEWTVVV